jgi:hypothetical protein
MGTGGACIVPEAGACIVKVHVAQDRLAPRHAAADATFTQRLVAAAP